MTPHIEKTADILAKRGIKHAFGVAGGGASLELITALEGKGVEYIPVAHEAAAVMMAGAISRGGKTKAVAITIKGPGFANAIPGILSNYYENRPALTISEAFGRDAPKFRMHKRMDHESAISKIIKGFAIADAEGKNLIRLLDIAEKEVPGPAHLDLCGEPEPEKNFDAPIQKFLDNSLFEEALYLIKNSSKPAIILGSLVLRKFPNVAWGALEVPVVTTAAAKGSIDETSRFSAGVITGEIKELSPEEAILKNADLIISFGLRNTEVVLARPFSTPLINIDVVDNGFSDGFQPKIHLITDDIAFPAEKIIALLSQKKWGSGIIEDWKKKLSAELFSHSWLPAQLFKSLQKTAPESALILDTGLFCTIGETVWEARSPENFLGSSVGRFMGTAIPTAIGFYISSPDKRIICAVGDGGVRPYFPELKIVVERNLPILFILMSDCEYGSVASSGKPKGLSANAFEIKNSTWWRAAGALGLESREIFNINDFERAVLSWKDGNKPMFLEAHFDPEAYLNMTSKLR